MENEQAKFQLVLGRGTINQEVLTKILDVCHFGCTLDPENKAQIGEYNVGVTILAKMGVFAEDTKDMVVNALCQIITKKEEEDEKDDVGSLTRGLESRD